jgi:hypothetical protein
MRGTSVPLPIENASHFKDLKKFAVTIDGSSQGRNLALATSFVPRLLDIGL